MRAVCDARSMTRSRVPGKRYVLLHTVPSDLATAMHTVPTGFSSVPPPGPAMPLVAIEMSAPVARHAPKAICSTTGMLTAPLLMITSEST